MTLTAFVRSQSCDAHTSAYLSVFSLDVVPLIFCAASVPSSTTHKCWHTNNGKTMAHAVELAHSKDHIHIFRCWNIQIYPYTHTHTLYGDKDDGCRRTRTFFTTDQTERIQPDDMIIFTDSFFRSEIFKTMSNDLIQPMHRFFATVFHKSNEFVCGWFLVYANKAVGIFIYMSTYTFALFISIDADDAAVIVGVFRFGCCLMNSFAPKSLPMSACESQFFSLQSNKNVFNANISHCAHKYSAITASLVWLYA